MHLDAVERRERFDLGQLLGLDIEGHILAERVDDLREQVLVGVGLEQHRVWQAADHYPLAQGNRKGFVVVDIRVGREEGRRVGVGLGGLLGDAFNFSVWQATRADLANEFNELVFHGDGLTNKKGRKG
ncbi:hypothetical protein D3C80_1503780 [compost metagenome]